MDQYRDDGQNRNGDALVVGDTYVVEFGDWGIEGRFTGKFVGWFDKFGKPSNDKWANAMFDTGLIAGDRWDAKRVNP